MKIKNLFWFVFWGLAIVSCKTRQGGSDFSPEYNPYVNAFTSGSVSIKSNITVQLSEESVFADDERVPDDLFEISPPVRGKIEVRNNGRTFVFVPGENLKANRDYAVAFNVGKTLKDADKKYRRFEFGFSTIKPSFYVVRDGLRLYDESMPHLFHLVREVHLSDYAEPEAVEKMLSVTMAAGQPIVRWEHQGNRHTFTIDSLRGAETAFDVMLKLDAKPVGGDVSDEESVVVPSRYEFDILSVTVGDENKETVITCRFSAPIEPKQDLKGFIKIDDIKFTYRIALNAVLLYPSEKPVGNVTLTIFEGLKSAGGGRYGKNYTKELRFESNNPEVRFVTRGNILPSSKDGTILPFQAVSLKSVTARIIKIYENNVLQFLQINALGGSSELRRAGRLVAVKTIALDENRTEKELKHWGTYALDLSKMILPEFGAIYRVELSFDKSQALIDCGDDEGAGSAGGGKSDEETLASLSAEYDKPGGSNYYYEDDGYYYEDDDYNSDSRNPCNGSYYRNKKAAKNILASDIGIVAKKGTNNLVRFVVTSIQSATPVPSVRMEVYNYQQQLIGSGVTGPDGFADVSVSGKPFIAVAKHANQRGYLHLNDGKALSLSRFDVSGDAVKDGVKGFLYGERGVWRPGDSIFLTFMLHDPEKQIPATHPVTVELNNPAGQLVAKQSKTNGTDGFYSFVFRTSENAPTGNWTATARVGGAAFRKNVKVETVKPNRLKINLDFRKKDLDLNEPLAGNLSAAWLHGAPAKNLKAEVWLYLENIKTVFRGFEDYAFDDPSKTFESDKITFFSGNLNDKGSVDFSERITVDSKSPGKLKASFVTRVFENGGDFSIDNHGVEVSPYKRYVGILPPKGTGYGNMLETEKDQRFDVVLLDKSGNIVDAQTELDITVHKMSWSWWWTSTGADVANYIQGSYRTPLKRDKIKLSGGRGVFTYKAGHSEYGNYLITVTDGTGHSAGTIAYYDWPGWGGRARQDSEGAMMLNFESDKEKYLVGEKAVIRFPSANTARALINIENGSRVLKSYWVNCVNNETQIEIQTTPEMSPNVYVSITLLQPHHQTYNDMPVRLFGVIPLAVEDPDTRLVPVLNVPETIRPGEKYKVSVSESKGTPMSYTLAVVDEGLLDLTRFKTPDPRAAFYAKEALGVNTWDMYEYLIGAYGGRIEQMFAVGGDDAASANRAKINRFKPVVRFIGPFTLEKGQKRTHELEMPNYIGSVRVMVVAGNGKAYGRDEKAVAVKKPLMVLATLPRVLSPGEEIDLPATVFVSEARISSADVSIETNALFTVSETKRSLRFSEPGETTTAFKVKVGEKIGTGRVKIIASSGNERSEHEVEIEIRTPNPPISKVKSVVMESGSGESFGEELPGMDGTNTARIEASFIPPLNLGKRLEYLISYPHGCVEQTTSAAFPQLYLGSVIEIGETEKTAASNNVKAALAKLKDFVCDGGFGYWPGSASPDEWATSYVGEFLVEAENKGFSLPGGMKQNWIKHQQKKAREWTPGASKTSNSQSDFIQAYRLFVLAKAKSPELGAMNRLKEDRTLTDQARWTLSAAYALAGQPEIATSMTEKTSTVAKEYVSPFSETFGSSTRDASMILDALILMKRDAQAFELVKQLSRKLETDQWLSTQSTAYALMAISRYAENLKDDKSISIEYSYNGKKEKANTSKPLWSMDLGKISSGKIEVVNKSSNRLYVRITATGIPFAGSETATENKIRIDLKYVDENGAAVGLEKMKQGTDFNALVSVTNLSPIRETYSNLALTHIFPSGWEIMNERMLGINQQSGGYDYCDIRDDRVLTYFSLDGGVTKVFKIKLNAAYVGKFYLPVAKVEAMYDGSITANNKGQWIEIE